MRVLKHWCYIGIIVLGLVCVSIAATPKKSKAKKSDAPAKELTAQKKSAASAESASEESTSEESADSAKYEVDPRFDFGGFRQPGNWYKGNLHLHTTISDGKLSPEDTAEIYRKAGWDFTAFTDHSKPDRDLTYPVDKINTSKFIVIPGAEHGEYGHKGETIHIVVVGPGYRKLPTGDEAKDIQTWWDSGAFVIWAHPYWSLNSTARLENLPFLPAVEIYNTMVSRGQGLRGNGEAWWDVLLNEKRHVFGSAEDDSHVPSAHACGGWDMVKAKALTEDDIVKSLRAGYFYASNGPTIEDVAYDTKGKIHVRCSPVQMIRVFSTVGRVSTQKAGPGKTITGASFNWPWVMPKTNKKIPFARVECIDAKGNIAWSQAVFAPETAEKVKKKK